MRALLLVVSAIILTGCMGQTSRNPPIEVWPDMDRQPKYMPQRYSEFFSDHRTDRQPVPGTVARGRLYEDDVLFTGIVDNNFVGRNPLPITAELLHQGQMRFNTYCAPCHDRTGSGKGLVPQKALWIPTSLHDDRVLKMNDGEIFNVISHGRRSMPPYRYQVQPQDRWAIVAYVRALQRTVTTIDEAPAEVRPQLTTALQALPDPQPEGAQTAPAGQPPAANNANPPAPEGQTR